jgi:nicotinate-nucleotide adenylyltransferase
MGPADELFFIMGWDSLLSLHLWYQADRLLNLCRIAAAPRPGYPRPDLASLALKLQGIADRVTIMERPLIDISATVIREKVRQGLPIDDLVPPDVAGYIREKRLYH